MAWGLENLFKAIKGGGRGWEGEGGGSGVKTPVTTVADSDYGRQLRGEQSPEYSDMLGGQDTNREDRNFARRFDPSDKESVLRMQQRLNKMGYTDEEGNSLAEDSMFGEKTLMALRSFQGVPYEAEGEEEPIEETSYDYEPGKGPSEPLDPWAETEGESTMMRNAPGSSPKSWVEKLFGETGERSGFGNSAMEGFRGYKEG